MALNAEQQRERDQLEMEILREEIAAEEAGAPQVAAAPAGYNEDRRGSDRLQAFAQGASLGFADEASAKLSQWLDPGDYDFGENMAPGTQSEEDKYSMYHEGLKEDRGAYAEEHPLEALGLEVAGGITTGSGGAGAARQLAKTGLGKAAAAAAATIGEGAIAGAGAADEGDRLGGAGRGAAMGAALPGAAALGRAGMDTAAYRRVAQELGKGLDFIPMNVANEGMLGDFYRNTVGTAFGGGNIRKQTERLTEKAGLATTAARETFEAAKETAKKVKARALAKVARKKEEALNALTEAGGKTATEIGETAGARGQQLSDEFMGEAIDSTIPVRANDLREAVVGKTPKEAMAAVDQHWLDNGFESVNSADFEIDEGLIKGLTDDLGEALADDPALRNAIPDPEAYVRKQLDTYLPDQPREGLNIASGNWTSEPGEAIERSGVISGKDLMELRNSFARNVKASADGAAKLSSVANRKVTGRIDDFIRDSLGGEGADAVRAFDDDLDRWVNVKTLRSAVDKSPVGAEGAFTPKNWGDAEKQTNKWRSRHGEMPLSKRTGQAQRAIEDVTAGQKAALPQAKEATRQAKREVRKESLKAKDVATANRPAAKRVAKKQAKLDRAMEAEKELQARAPKNASTFARLFSTGLLGSAGGMAGGWGTTIPIGAAVAKTLSTETAQRALAGQTGTQKMMAELLKKYDAGTAKKIMQSIGRGGTRSAALSAGGS